MPQDYYSDNSGDTEDSTSAAPDTATESPERKDADEGETFLISKSALGGKDPEPGDICKFECVRTYEDEAEFKYLKHDDESESDNEDMAAANSEMDSMAEEG